MPPPPASNAKLCRPPDSTIPVQPAHTQPCFATASFDAVLPSCRRQGGRAAQGRVQQVQVGVALGLRAQRAKGHRGRARGRWGRKGVWLGVSARGQLLPLQRMPIAQLSSRLDIALARCLPGLNRPPHPPPNPPPPPPPHPLTGAITGSSGGTGSSITSSQVIAQLRGLKKNKVRRVGWSVCVCVGGGARGLTLLQGSTGCRCACEQAPGVFWGQLAGKQAQ